MAITQRDIEDVLVRFDSGESVAYIAERLALSVTSIYTILKTNSRWVRPTRFQRRYKIELHKNR